MSNNMTGPQVAMTGMIAAFGTVWGKIGWLILLCAVCMALCSGCCVADGAVKR